MEPLRGERASQNAKAYSELQPDPLQFWLRRSRGKPLLVSCESAVSLSPLIDQEEHLNLQAARIQLRVKQFRAEGELQSLVACGRVDLQDCAGGCEGILVN